MNKLFKNTNPHTPEVLYVFEHMTEWSSITRYGILR
jgi:hypothetical protein